MSILFTIGICDENTARTAGLDDFGRVKWVFDGGCDVRHNLPLDADAADSVMLFGPGITQSEIRLRRKPSLVFNQISNPDTHAGSLSRCAELCRQLSVPVINHPESILKTARDGVYGLLRDVPGVRMPRTARVRLRRPSDVSEMAEKAGIDFPLIVRTAGPHNGAGMVRLKGTDDYDSLNALPFDGREFYLVEFIDYRNQDGLYVKQRIIVIDGEPDIEHSLASEHWKVHYDYDYSAPFNPAKYGMEPLEEEAKYLLKSARPVVSQICDRLGLDFFGIDLSFSGAGELIVFEANACMNLLAISDESDRFWVEVYRRMVLDLIRRKSGNSVSGM